MSAPAIGTVKHEALRLLAAVDYYERRDEPRGESNRTSSSDRLKGVKYDSVGLSYAEILRRLRERFPEAGTSVACLRWYAVHTRGGDEGYEGVVLPYRRPRSGRRSN